MTHATQPLCRSSDPLTSYQAADAAKQLIRTHERLIVAALEQYGAMGVDAIAARCGLEPHAVGKRMHALEINLSVRLTGQVVKSGSGRNQREWSAL